MIDLDEFLTHLEVQTNLLNEAKREQELYERGVIAMRQSRGLDAKDFAVGKWEREVEIVIDPIIKESK